MSEAERGKKAIFDQDSNPWVPWDPQTPLHANKKDANKDYLKKIDSAARLELRKSA